MRFIDEFSKKFISDDEYRATLLDCERIHEEILNKTCLGNQMMGWFDFDHVELENLKNHAEKINDSSDVVLVIGIGGSYLGASAAIEFLHPVNEKKVIFIGFCLDSEYLHKVFEICDDKNIHVVVISKSGNTIEVQATLQMVLEYMRKRYGTNLKDKFTSVTGQSGFLKSFSEESNWKIFGIPENIGGRFSVLSNAGLLPIIISGANAGKILEGARFAKKKLMNTKSNCYKYAAMRNILDKLNFDIEIFCAFSMRMGKFLEWIRQLFAESEGKEGKGIFPVSSLLSTDLHSIGQFVQEGKKILFETILICKNNCSNICLENDANFKTKFDSFEDINNKILNAISNAHSNDGVPVNLIEFEEYSEFELGYLFFFFEISCWISSNLMKIDPSTQPGVQKYKELLR